MQTEVAAKARRGCVRRLGGWVASLTGAEAAPYNDGSCLTFAVLVLRSPGVGSPEQSDPVCPTIEEVLS